MSREEFEKVVNAGIESIPKEFLDKLDNVAITIDDTPSPQQIRKFHLSHGFTLFGLYEGISQASRMNYTAVLPDKITIFQDPIEAAAKDETDMKEIVKHTVWHEIAHHFGMNEEEVRSAEAVRMKRTEE